jgi:DNA-directed RNA polymerase specialized sigma24 family protein
MGSRVPMTMGAERRRVAVVAQPPPLDRLPLLYGTVLRLREAGLSDEAIAAHLEMRSDAVAPLVRTARAKLDAVAAQPSEPSE